MNRRPESHTYLLWNEASVRLATKINCTHMTTHRILWSLSTVVYHRSRSGSMRCKAVVSTPRDPLDLLAYATRKTHVWTLFEGHMAILEQDVLTLAVAMIVAVSAIWSQSVGLDCDASDPTLDVRMTVSHEWECRLRAGSDDTPRRNHAIVLILIRIATVLHLKEIVVRCCVLSRIRNVSRTGADELLGRGIIGTYNRPHVNGRRRNASCRRNLNAIIRME